MTNGCLFRGVLFSALLLSVPAAAEELAGADLRDAHISRADCARISAYLPRDNDAAYVPGVAADGSAVVPADIGGGYGYGSRPVYEFDITLDPLIGRNPTFNSATKMVVGHVMFEAETGRVTIDGHEVAGGNHALAEACARLHHKPVK